MGKSHPIELRSRVIAFVEEGLGHRKAARHVRVSPRFVNDMVILKRANGGLLPTPQVNHAMGKLASYVPWLRERSTERCRHTPGNFIAVDRALDLHNPQHKTRQLMDRRFVRFDRALHPEIRALIGGHRQANIVDDNRGCFKLLDGTLHNLATDVGSMDIDPLPRGLPCSLQRRGKTSDFTVTPVEPIRAPDPVELPAEVFKDVLPQPVTLTRP